MYGGFPKVSAAAEVSDGTEEPELEKVKSSDNVIAGFLQDNQGALETEGDKKEDEAVEGAPEVEEVEEAAKEEVPAREVATTGTT